MAFFIVLLAAVCVYCSTSVIMMKRFLLLVDHHNNSKSTCPQRRPCRRYDHYRHRHVVFDVDVTDIWWKSIIGAFIIVAIIVVVVVPRVVAAYTWRSTGGSIVGEGRHLPSVLGSRPSSLWGRDDRWWIRQRRRNGRNVEILSLLSTHSSRSITSNQDDRLPDEDGDTSTRPRATAAATTTTITTLSDMLEQSMTMQSNNEKNTIIPLSFPTIRPLQERIQTTYGPTQLSSAIGQQRQITLRKPKYYWKNVQNIQLEIQQQFSRDQP